MDKKMIKPTEQLTDLLALMATLRDQCPWDAKQTNLSLIPYAIEEVYELIDAIHAKNDETIKEELGDVLLQVVFHAHLYDEQGKFAMGDVIFALQDKLIRRHPHVFAKESLLNEVDVKRRWDEIKQDEKLHKQTDAFVSILDDVKPAPAFIQAVQLRQKAMQVGFDWQSVGDAFAKLEEEVDELKQVLPMGAPTDAQKQKLQDEVGDCLFMLLQVAHKLEIDGESALLASLRKFRHRFAYMERALAKQGKDIKQADLAEMEAGWHEAKLQEKMNGQD